MLITTVISGTLHLMSRGHETLANDTENKSYFCQYSLKKKFLQFIKQILKIYYKNNMLIPNNGSQ